MGARVIWAKPFFTPYHTSARKQSDKMGECSELCRERSEKSCAMWKIGKGELCVACGKIEMRKERNGNERSEMVKQKSGEDENFNSKKNGKGDKM